MVINMRKIRMILEVIVLMGLFSMLFGCTKKPEQGESNNASANVNHNNTVDEIIVTDDGIRADIDDGGVMVRPDRGDYADEEMPEITVETAALEELCLNCTGTAREPYYMIKSDGNGGYYLKTTWTAPENLPYELGVEDEADSGDIYKYVSDVMDCEHGSSVHLTDAERVNKVRDALYAYGAIDWDGFDEHKSLGDGVLDGDRGFTLKFRLADGKSVYAHGYNRQPKNFEKVYSIIIDLIDGTADYSRYVEKDFHASVMDGLFVEFKDSFACRQYFKIELNSAWKRWSIQVRDPWGELLDRDFEISDYGDVKDASELPYDRFVAILDKYNVSDWEDSSASDYGAPSYNIRLTFENNKSFEAGGNLLPEKYNEFRREILDEIIKYYDELKK
ncbi:MAG: hypothetical protein MJ131_04455 [Lachnospiraceae bacterium]|nr:hypothetical protein [Lachnospiraceae bacterium]